MNIWNENRRLGAIFTWGEALEAEMTRREADRLAPHRITHGYYSFTQVVPPYVRVEAILRVAGRDGAVCGPTALSLAGVDLPARLARDTRVWVQVPHQQNWPRRAGVRLVRPTHPGPTCSRRGLPTVELPYCWVQMAGESGLDELVELADAMTCRQHPVTTKAALAAAVGSRAGARGIARARAALDLCVEGTDSIPETDLRLLLVRAGLPTPRVNMPIVDAAGRVIYLLDLAYEDEKVAIEYDGAYHGDPRQMSRDATRRRVLEDQGWRVITVTAADMATDSLGIVASVLAALSRDSIDARRFTS